MKTFHRIKTTVCLFLIIAFLTSGIVAAASEKIVPNVKQTTEKLNAGESSTAFNWLAGTIWEIRDFDGKTAKVRADNAKWVFSSHNKVGAYVPLNYWNGDWKQLTNDRIQVNIGSGNAAELIFINQQYFIAIDHSTKNFRYTGERTK
jgi:hypothetical protein